MQTPITESMYVVIWLDWVGKVGSYSTLNFANNSLLEFKDLITVIDASLGSANVHSEDDVVKQSRIDNIKCEIKHFQYNSISPAFHNQWFIFHT